MSVFSGVRGKRIGALASGAWQLAELLSALPEAGRWLGGGFRRGNRPAWLMRNSKQGRRLGGGFSARQPPVADSNSARR
jgi:hypothetical protein